MNNSSFGFKENRIQKGEASLSGEAYDRHCHYHFVKEEALLESESRFAYNKCHTVTSASGLRLKF